MKFDRLEGWGEDSNHDEHENDETGMMEIDKDPSDRRDTIIDLELKKKKEPTAAQKMISKEVRKKTFKYKKKGKLRVDEMVELRKTTPNVFDWMKAKVETTVELDEMNDEEENSAIVIALEREERLEKE